MLLPASQLFRLSAVAGLLFGATAAQAQDEWHVTRVSGDAWKMSGTASTPLVTGAELQIGDKVKTGARGRVLISRGAESMMLGRDTAIEFGANADPQVTTILQQSGSLELEVEKRGVPHFEVETPFLVAAVKGTHFKVTVGPRRAGVNVERGLVDVGALKTGLHVGVAAGQSTSLDAAGTSLVVSGPGEHAAIEHGDPRTPHVAALAPEAAPVARRVAGHAKPHRVARAAPARHPVSPDETKLGRAVATDGDAAAPQSGPEHRDTIFMRSTAPASR